MWICLSIFLALAIFQRLGFSLDHENVSSSVERALSTTVTPGSITHMKQLESRRRQRRSLRHRRCGWKGHARAMRPCENNDTYCGSWQGRFWVPIGCEYDDVSPVEARKCVGNRTLAFIGDSQIRDLAVGVAFLLMGVDMAGEEGDHTIGDVKIDKNYDLHTNGTRIENFPFWKNNVPGHNYNGHTFPKADVAAEQGWEWQVQMWSLYKNEFIHEGQVMDVLSNKMSTIGRPQLRKIDLGFWNHGLHDYGWWEKDPGPQFYETMVKQWINVRLQAAFPTVWVSMNPNCEEKLSFTLTPGKKKFQADIVEAANKYVNEKLLEEKLPYFDAAAPLRSNARCEYSADGLHVKMFVDNMRAKMLFNHLCDHEFNWKSDVLSHFV